MIDTADRIALHEKIVSEALSWLNTPYHKGGRVKGVGCDCGTFLLGVLQNCGLAQGTELERYTQDWFCHTSDQRYLRDMMKNAALVAEAISYPTLNAVPGDLVLTKSAGSRLYNHAGIVVKWPKVIHAVDPKVMICDASSHKLWCYRTIAVFDPFKEKE